MEKQILIDQINDTLSKALQFISMDDYINFKDGLMDIDVATYWKNMIQEFSWLVNVVYDI